MPQPGPTTRPTASPAVATEAPTAANPSLTTRPTASPVKPAALADGSTVSGRVTLELSVGGELVTLSRVSAAGAVVPAWVTLGGWQLDSGMCQDV